MKKIMNDASQIVEEMITGMCLAHDNIIKRLDGTDVILRKEIAQDKVALISGGGSGHEPAHAGFVGEGMLDAAVCGAVFTSPTPDQILEAIKAVDTGQGVLMIVKNYSGDIMNFEMAQEFAAMEGITVEYIVVDDDIAVEDSTYTAGKRGVAGTVLVHKILGAAAESGMDLLNLKALGEAVVKKIKTVGVALTGATVPEVGKPGFILADDEIEYGVGIHGEPGYRKEKIKPSLALAQELTSKIANEFNWQANDHFGILVNGLGATPLMEQYVFTQDTLSILKQAQLKVPFKMVGNYMTAIDMSGISLTMIQLNEDILAYLNAPAYTIAWKEM